MAADPADYFQKVGRSTATTLSAPGFTAGGTSITVGSTTNWDTTTGVTFAIDEVDSSGERVVGTYNVFRGKVSSATSITGMVYVGGDAARNYSAGATTRVYILVSSYRDNRLVDGLLVSHKQTGAMIDSLPLTTPKITTSINDTNGNELFKVTATASAVNEFTVANAATGNGPTLSVTGGDTNIDMNFAPKGTGKLKGVVNNLFNPYKASAYKASDTAMSANTWTKVTLDTELFDTGSNFDSSTNYRFVAPIAGFYNVNAQVSIAGAGMSTTAYAEGAVYKNGSALFYLGTRQQGSGNSNLLPRLNGSKLIQLAAADYIELYGYISEIRDMLGGATLTYMTVQLVSTT